MLRGTLICLSTLFLVACGEKDEPDVLGSPSDVRTAPGTYEGYEIVDHCELAHDYGVVGIGTRWYDDVAPGDAGRPDALTDFGYQVLKPALADIDSVHTIGWGRTCTGNSGVSLGISDYRDVDGAFSIVGRILAEGDLREEIAISVEGVPVAL